MFRILDEAARYVAAVFAAGFVLGTVRTLWIAPALGPTAAVALEAPAMLAVSWLAWRWVRRADPAPQTLADRVAVGALAFAVLMLAETVLAVTLFHRTLAEHLASFATLAGAIGLAAQLGFAAIPAVADGAGHAGTA
jgi:hypothetical protein